MSSVCELNIQRDFPITMIHGKLKSHVIIFDPPYDIASILMEFCRHDGQPVKIRIDHSSRDVTIIQPSISRMVLTTAVRSFQNHRLRMGVTHRPFIPPRLPSFPSHSADMFASRDVRLSTNHYASRNASNGPRSDTGKTCCICMEKIFQTNLEILQCAHMFHRNCIARWSREQPNCPECRHPLT